VAFSPSLSLLLSSLDFSYSSVFINNHCTWNVTSSFTFSELICALVCLFFSYRMWEPQEQRYFPIILEFSIIICHTKQSCCRQTLNLNKILESFYQTSNDYIFTYKLQEMKYLLTKIVMWFAILWRNYGKLFFYEIFILFWHPPTWFIDYSWKVHHILIKVRNVTKGMTSRKRNLFLKQSLIFKDLTAFTWISLSTWLS
jgi:hypothetical protein